MLGGDGANAMHDQRDIVGKSGPTYRAYRRRAKVGDADCYSFEAFATMCKIGAGGVICLANGFDDQA